MNKKVLFNPKASKAEKVYMKELENRQSPLIFNEIQKQKAKIDAERSKGVESPA